MGTIINIKNNKLISSSLLNLVPLSSADFDIFKQVYTDPETMSLVGEVMSNASALKLFLHSIKQFDENRPRYHFYVIKNKKNRRLGMVGLFWNQPQIYVIEMGVMILKEYSKKGYAIKALKLLMQFAFNSMDIKSIVAFCNEKNLMANRVSYGLGYKKKGTFKDKKTQQQKIKWEITREQFQKI